MEENFKLPTYHSWPFFFTIQLNLDTKERQMKMWSDLIINYCKSKQIYATPLNELYNSQICINSDINRRLSMDSLKQICEWMEKNKFAEFTSDSKDKIFVYWRSIQEVADAIYKWADNQAKIGSVEAVVDICEDSDNKNELFYKMPIEIVMKALYALQDVGKAQVFYSENTDAHGVKFFHI